MAMARLRVWGNDCSSDRAISVAHPSTRSRYRLAMPAAKRSATWLQVAALRLDRQHLATRLGPDALVDVARDIVGIHAQVSSAAELQFAARIDGLRRSDVRDAILDRPVVKTWAMRGTLHLLAPDDLWQFVAAWPTRDGTRAPAWLKYFKVTLEQRDAIEEAIGAVLVETPQTRAVLADAVGERLADPVLGARLKSGWGEFLKPAAGRGLLAFGPDDGRNVTFVSPTAWLSDRPDGHVEPLVALGRLVERYLAAFPGSGREATARWWGIASRPKISQALTAAESDVVDVDVEGTAGWVRSADLAALTSASPPAAVRLLPGFDPFTNELPRRTEALLAVARHALVHRTAGWVSPVVVLDGRVAGTWELPSGRGSEVAIQPFDRWRSVKAELASEIDRLAAFLDKPLKPVIAAPLPPVD